MTCVKRFGELSLKTTKWTVFGFGPQNSGGVSARMEDGTWRHREACIEVKESCEEPMAIRLANLELDHNALGVRWFSSKYLGASWECVIVL